ncbi:MAG: hypothetical protein OHK0031_07550 [Anaerolineales bacterium]
MKFWGARVWRILGPVLWLALSALYLLLYLRVMLTPEQRSGSDFIAFYSAGRIAREQGFPLAYDIAAQRQIQAALVGFPLAEGQVLLYNHLPFLLPALALMALPNYLAAFFLWQAALLTLMLGALQIFYRLPLALSAAEKWAALFFFPLFFSLLNGQDSAAVLLALAAWSFFLWRGRDFSAGLALSLLALRPQWAILFCLPFFFQRRGVLAGALTGAAGLALLSFSLLGWRGAQDFLQILSISAGGEWYGMKENAMFNLLGILARAFPAALPQARLMAWAVYAFFALALIFVWRSSGLSLAAKISWQILAACFFSPHLHFHDLSVLVFPLLLLLPAWRNLLRGKIPAWACLLLLSFALMFSQALAWTKFFVPYLLMILLAVVLWRFGNDAGTL